VNEEQTCFSLIEKLQPLLEEYGEEQILAALWFCIKRDFIGNDYFEPVRESRMHDLVEIISKWESQNEPL
jgi:hypothetical protein